MEQAASAQSKHVALFVATISAFIAPFLSSAVSVALPTIGREFQMDAVTLGWISTAYLLVAAIALVPIGRLGDIHGRKRIWLWGISIYSLFSLLCAAAPSGDWLIVFRCLQAVGGTLIFGSGMAILTSVYPRAERGKALGINVAAVYVGLSVGPFLGGILTNEWGWRSIFLATVPLGLLAIGLILWHLHGEWAEARGERFDVVGSLLYCLALIALMYGISIVATPYGAALAVLGAAGLVAFIWWELRTPTPVLDVKLFRGNLVFTFANLTALINYAATAAVTFLLSLYLQYVQGLSPALAGLVLIAQPVVMVALSVLAGRLSDRVEPRLVVAVGMSLTAVGLFALTTLSVTTPLWFVVGVLVVLGVGFGCFASPNTNAVMSAVDSRFYGVAAGILGTMRLTGQMVGMGATMTTFGLFLGQQPIGPGNLPAFLAALHTACLLFAVLSCGGVVASLVRTGPLAEEPQSARAHTV